MPVREVLPSSWGSKHVVIVLRHKNSHGVSRFLSCGSDPACQMQASAETAQEELRVRCSADPDCFSRYFQMTSSRRKRERQNRRRRHLAEICIGHHNRVVDESARHEVVEIVRHRIALGQSRGIFCQHAHSGEASFPVADKLLPRPSFSSYGPARSPSIDPYGGDNRDDTAKRLNPSGPLGGLNGVEGEVHFTGTCHGLAPIATGSSDRAGQADGGGA